MYTNTADSFRIRMKMAFAAAVCMVATVSSSVALLVGQASLA